MLKNWIGSGAVLSICLLAGCHGSSGDSGSATASNTPAATTQPAKVPIPADSPFAKVKEGMSKDEVYTTLGQPTTQGAYATGKAFIPFHFGGDNYRMIARYKGQGTIIFSQDSRYTSGMSVIEVNYDPNELGYEKQQ